MAANPNTLFGFQNLSDVDYYSPTFLPGVGNWQPKAPLTNLQNRFLAFKARSVNCTTDATRFVVDLTQPQPVLAVTIPRHNLTLSATITVGLYSDAACTQAVGTPITQPVATTFAWGSLPFGDISWFTGTIDAERARFFPQPAMVIFPTANLARYVQVQINDTGNPAGYVELARLFVCPGYQPSINIKYGAQPSVEDPSILTTSLGGADYYDLRTKRRNLICQIDGLNQYEAFSNIFMAQLRLGISGQFFFSMYPADPALFALTSFVATLSKMDAMTAASYGLYGAAFSIREVIA